LTRIFFSVFQSRKTLQSDAEALEQARAEGLKEGEGSFDLAVDELRRQEQAMNKGAKDGKERNKNHATDDQVMSAFKKRMSGHGHGKGGKR
jgi:hypothetical protein